MKFRVFNLILLFVLFSSTLSLIIFAQEDKSVTLIVTGEGKIKDDAKQSALRNAIEQAFGTFISSKTDILNDELIKDEIILVSNGNIQKYEMISEGQLPDGSFYGTLKATVSISKLTSFCESKDISVEFKGELFRSNIKLQELNEKNEVKAIENMCHILRQLSNSSFNRSLFAGEPYKYQDKWRIVLLINVSVNNNFYNIPKIIYKTLSELSLTKDEALNYDQLNKPMFPISIAVSENEFGHFILRNGYSIMPLIEQIYYFNHSILNFKIGNGITEMSLNKLGNVWIVDPDFRPLMRVYKQKNNTNAYATASLFFDANCPGWKTPPKNYYTGQEKCLHPILDYKEFLVNINKDFPFWTYLNPNQANLGKSNLGVLLDPLDYFKGQFSFVNKLLDQLIDGQTTGIVISFIGIESSKEDLISILCFDERTVDEISKITEYKIIPLGME